MRSVIEHQAAVLAGVVPLEAVDVDLLDAVGQTLARDVVAPWPLPSFDNSAMDGYAVLASDVVGASASAPVTLSVIGDLAAGVAGGGAVTPGVAIRIMTGAPMPPGADAVVPVELTDGGTAEVRIQAAVEPGRSVRRRGEDVGEGTTVLTAGSVVTDRAVPVLAAVGCATVPVLRRPRVLVVSTGDELVEPGTPLTHGRISDSNGLMLAALARSAGAEVSRSPIVPDDSARLRAVLDAAAIEFDVVVTSGGVSMGAYDTVKAVLAPTGEVEFAKVAMHPGMPQGTGRLGARRVPVVTLPGNPVSSFISFELFVRPLIRQLLGLAPLTRDAEPAVCLDSFDSPAGKQQYARAILSVRPDGVRQVRPVGGQGSHVVGALAQANALVVVPPEVTHVGAGEIVTVIDLQRVQA
jgi:molybdopterin molybdotransferase